MDRKPQSLNCNCVTAGKGVRVGALGQTFSDSEQSSPLKGSKRRAGAELVEDPTEREREFPALAAKCIVLLPLVTSVLPGCISSLPGLLGRWVSRAGLSPSLFSFQLEQIHFCFLYWGLPKTFLCPRKVFSFLSRSQVGARL